VILLSTLFSRGTVVTGNAAGVGLQPLPIGIGRTVGVKVLHAGRPERAIGYYEYLMELWEGRAEAVLEADEEGLGAVESDGLP